MGICAGFHDAYASFLYIEDKNMEINEKMMELVAALRRSNLHIATCESLTAGLFAAHVASIAHASQVLKGGIIAYQNEVKEQIVGGPAALIKQHGVVSSACVKAMAKAVKERFRCEIGISFSGNAGPDCLEGKPVGCVYMGIALHEECFAYELQLKGSRNAIREQCVRIGCEEVLKLIKRAA